VIASRKLFVLIVTLLLSASLALAQQEEPMTHLVQYGDTLYKIAIKYGVTMDEIAKANGLSNASLIKVGQTLVIPGLSLPGESAEGETVENPLIAGAPTTHIVQPGETLASIANRYGITLSDLLKSNNISNPDLIYRGQELSVWTTESVQVEENPAPEDLPVLSPSLQIAGHPEVLPDVDVRTAAAVQATHIVQRGETLARIAGKYGISWTDIVKANSLTNADTIYAGQELIIPSVSNPEGAEDLGIVAGIQGPAVVPPTPEIAIGKFILVDLSDSRVYAYEDGKFVFTALGSMGLPATPTVQGKFKIYNRYESQTMSGPGYYLPGVQWVQYFYSGYALHSAYWHSNWGQPMSHGCVNLRTEDAKWLFDFGTIGTPIHVQL
jgi:LysM repeat protein